MVVWRTNTLVDQIHDAMILLRSRGAAGSNLIVGKQFLFCKISRLLHVLRNSITQMQIK